MESQCLQFFKLPLMHRVTYNNICIVYKQMYCFKDFKQLADFVLLILL